MNINEAYQKVMETIQQLKDIGIRVEMFVPHYVDDKELIDKYKDGLDASLWKHVELYPVTQHQRELIYQHRTKLIEVGIIFDSGAGTCIDWEIDWCLTVNDNQDEIDSSLERNSFVLNTTTSEFQLPIVH